MSTGVAMEFSDGHRQPRPTYRVLKSLPQESFANERQRSSIRLFVQDPTSPVRLYDLDQPLLNDARSYFPDRTPDRHSEASKSARQPVFEVRDRDGAGWRGAIITDDAGDPWLIYADRHDHFHAHVADAVSATVSQATGSAPLDNKKPTRADYKIRDREERLVVELLWRGEVINRVIVGIAEALKSSGPTPVELPAAPGQPLTASLTINFEDHEPPQVTSGGLELEQSSSLATVELKCFGPSHRAIDAALQEILPFIHSETCPPDAHYDLDGNMVVWLTVSHTKLAQIMAASELADPQTGLPAVEPQPLTHLHYVSRTGLTEAIIKGLPQRGVCGLWFVPTQDEGCNLPVCPDCERQLPTAQRVADLIRRHLSVQ
ncbi:DUF3039 domain-containing protein [Propionibacterium ruminifibrarum]|nr:DUF3039 domain-containing protein [Propionibacterium ruminifibrarum]